MGVMVKNKVARFLWTTVYMPLGRYTCGVHLHIVLDVGPDPPGGREIWSLNLPA